MSGWNGKIGNLVQLLVEKEDKAEKDLKSHHNLAESHVLENNLKAEHVILKIALVSCNSVAINYYTCYLINLQLMEAGQTGLTGPTVL